MGLIQACCAVMTSVCFYDVVAEVSLLYPLGVLSTDGSMIHMYDAAGQEDDEYPDEDEDDDGQQYHQQDYNHVMHMHQQLNRQQQQQQHRRHSHPANPMQHPALSLLLTAGGSGSLRYGAGVSPGHHGLDAVAAIAAAELQASSSSSSHAEAADAATAAAGMGGADAAGKLTSAGSGLLALRGLDSLQAAAALTDNPAAAAAAAAGQSALMQRSTSQCPEAAAAAAAAAASAAAAAAAAAAAESADARRQHLIEQLQQLGMQAGLDPEAAATAARAAAAAAERDQDMGAEVQLPTAAAAAGGEDNAVRRSARARKRRRWSNDEMMTKEAGGSSGGEGEVSDQGAADHEDGGSGNEVGDDTPLGGARQGLADAAIKGFVDGGVFYGGSRAAPTTAPNKVTKSPRNSNGRGGTRGIQGLSSSRSPVCKDLAAAMGLDLTAAYSGARQDAAAATGGGQIGYAAFDLHHLSRQHEQLMGCGSEPLPDVHGGSAAGSRQAAVMGSIREQQGELGPRFGGANCSVFASLPMWKQQQQGHGGQHQQLHGSFGGTLAPIPALQTWGSAPEPGSSRRRQQRQRHMMMDLGVEDAGSDHHDEECAAADALTLLGNLADTCVPAQAVAAAGGQVASVSVAAGSSEMARSGGSSEQQQQQQGGAQAPFASGSSQQLMEAACGINSIIESAVIQSVAETLPQVLAGFSKCVATALQAAAAAMADAQLAATGGDAMQEQQQQHLATAVDQLLAAVVAGTQRAITAKAVSGLMLNSSSAKVEGADVRTRSGSNDGATQQQQQPLSSTGSQVNPMIAALQSAVTAAGMLDAVALDAAAAAAAVAASDEGWVKPEDQGAAAAAAGAAMQLARLEMQGSGPAGHHVQAALQHEPAACTQQHTQGPAQLPEAMSVDTADARRSTLQQPPVAQAAACAPQQQQQEEPATALLAADTAVTSSGSEDAAADGGKVGSDSSSDAGPRGISTPVAVAMTPGHLLDATMA